MLFVARFRFGDVGEVFDRRFVVARALIERAEREMCERRRVRHRMHDRFALPDHFRDLEAEPAAFVFAQDFVGGEVEVEDAARLVLLGAVNGAPDE